MIKKVLFAIIFCLAILPAVSVSATTFKTSNLQGTWYGYMAEVDTDSGDGYWIRLKLDINSSGTVATTSTYTDPLGPTKNFTGGSLSLDSTGKLSGTLTTSTATVTIEDGKMDRGKTIAGFAYTTDDDTLGEGTLIKDEGSFQTSNLAGTWHGYLAEVDVDPVSGGDAYWIRLKLDLDSSGNVQTTSTYTDPWGPPGNFTGGKLSLDSSGKLSGYLYISSVTVTIQHGKMDQGKTIAGFAYTTDDDAIGEGNLIKAGGSFQTNNLKGTWHGYYMEVDDISGDAYWIYATLDVNSSGGVTGGSFTTPYNSGNFTGGSLSLSSSGILSGTINTSLSNTVTISHGKMDQGKTIVGFVDTTSNNELDVGLFIKAGIAGSNVGSQLLLLLD
jgi:hypothetical protein